MDVISPLDLYQRLATPQRSSSISWQQPISLRAGPGRLATRLSSDQRRPPTRVRQAECEAMESQLDDLQAETRRE